jgi:putative RecB family exonuclease
MTGVALPVPTSLSPSRVEAFTTCPLAFRFASIDKLPEPPSPHTAKGNLVHRALELLFCAEPEQRTPSFADEALDRAVAEARDEATFALLGLDTAAEAHFVDDARALVHRLFVMEDPRAVRAIGIELFLTAEVGPLALRGIIDRLELDAQGELIVSDYKTGRAPSLHYEQRRLGGVHFYAFLCEQVFGRRPARVQLLYLRSGEVIQAYPSEQSVRFLPRRTAAVYQAIERACAAGEFRPRPGPLCAHCAYQRWCPAFGGDPEQAAREAPEILLAPAAA